MASSSEAVKRLVYRTDVQGSDETVRRLGSVAAAQGGIASAMAETRSRTAELQDRYERVSRQQADYARIIAANTTAITAAAAATSTAAAANDNYATKSSHLSDVLRIGTKAAIDHAASWLATAGAVGAGVLVFGGLLAILGPIILAYKLVAGAVGLAADAWRLGGDELDRHRKIAEDAAKVDLSTSYFQKLTKGAEAAKVPVDALSTAFANLQKSSAEQLGGSALQQRLDDLVKAGNFSGNSGVQEYAGANTTEQRYQAIVSLINQAMSAGQRLAALDIAGTAFGPQAVENLRKDSEYFDKINAAAVKVADTQIVSPEDVGRALDLKTRYDAAVTILETRWHPVQDLLTQAGIEFRANWVSVVETIAQGFDWAAKLVAKLGEVPAWFSKKINEGSQWIIDNTTTPESRAAAEKDHGLTSDPVEMAKGTDAYAIAVNKLRAGLQNQAEMQRKVAEANTIAQKSLGDNSKQIDKGTKSATEQADAYDRALESVAKHTARMQADAQAVGLGAGALEEFRARTQLTAAAQLAGRDMTAGLTAEIDKQAKAAGEAARNLALVRAQAQADFALQTAGLSGVEARIAQVQYQLHGDGWKNFMNDGLAATMRLTDQLKSMVDFTNTFGQSLTQALASGKSGTDALGAAVSAVGTKMSSELMTKATSNIVQGAVSADPMQMAQGGLQAVSAIAISWLQGSAAKAKKAQEDFKQAQDAWAKMAGEVAKFKDQMLGQNTGSLGAAISDATERAQSYADAAHKAGQETGDLTAVLATYIQRMTRDFIVAFDATIEALNQGLGMDSPAVKAAANVKGIGDTLKGFIDDTVKATQGLAQGGPAIEAASAASQSYALSLLQMTPALTTVQTALLTLRGNAQQLQTTLQDLGMTADNAGASISAGIKTALASISATFQQGLQEQINSATGKGYLNDMAALLKTGASNLSDAQSLGLDPTLVVRAFQVQAQAIVDSAGLVGSAFDDFIAQFPELSGVVNQSATAIKSLSDATTDFYSSLRKTISTYLHDLNVGAQSALSPGDRLARAKNDYSTQLALAQGGNRDAIGSITQYSSNLLSAAKDYFASSAGYADILNRVQSQLAELPAAAEGADPVVAELKQVTANTGNTVATLSALQSIQNATKSASVDISASVVQLGAQSAYVADVQGSGYFGPMVAYLSQIAEYTRLSGQAAAQPADSFTWWNPFTWFAEGGRVTGGTPGKDSVMAMLMPDEFVVKPGPASAYQPLLEAMNAGVLPPLRHFADGGMVMPVSVQLPTISAAYGGSVIAPAGNDNGQHFAALGNTLVRAITGAAMAEITSNKEEMAMLRAEIASLRRALEGGRPKAPQAGTRLAS